jgi:hypothetical protein
VANRLCVYERLAPLYGYTTEAECFEDRAAHRTEWYDLICEYNREDKARLTKAVLAQYDIYVGMRSAEECRAALPLFDLVLWVDASGRSLPDDPTMKIAIGVADIVIQNDETEEAFLRRIDALVSTVFSHRQ